MSSDAHTGGRLEDLAPTGTSIPGDAGIQNTIRSVPAPDVEAQKSARFGAPDLAGAADNARDIPRRTFDTSVTGEVLTGTGDQLPSTAETKRMDFYNNTPSAKGHGRDAKHQVQKDSQFDRMAGEGPEMDEPAARK